MYDSLSVGRCGCKRDSRDSQSNRKQRDLTDLRWGVVHGDRNATRIRDLMLDCMVAITLADGEIEEPELQTMAQVYAELMAIEPDLAELRAREEDIQRQVAGAVSAPWTR